VWFAVPRIRGLGVHDLEVKNSALLDKWNFKLLTKDGVWQTLIKRKYIGSKALSEVLWKSEDSHFWAGLMATKKFSSVMILFDKRWIVDLFLGGLLARESSSQ
jgi:hypothetical protein